MVILGRQAKQKILQKIARMKVGAVLHKSDDFEGATRNFTFYVKNEICGNVKLDRSIN